MSEQNNNPDFFSYNGTVGRKNYAINMAILTVLFVLTGLINVSALTRFSEIKFLGTILQYMVWMFQFVLVFSALSLVYRRFADISDGKSDKFKSVLKSVFVIVFVIPILYVTVLRAFFDIIPGFIAAGDLLTVTFFFPAAIIVAVIISFIKLK